MTIALKVEGMTCQHCVKAVTAAIQARDPQARVSIDLAGQSVTAETALDRAAVAAVVEEEGYRIIG
jgi:copper chaperone